MPSTAKIRRRTIDGGKEVVLATVYDGDFATVSNTQGESFQFVFSGMVGMRSIEMVTGTDVFPKLEEARTQVSSESAIPQGNTPEALAFKALLDEINEVKDSITALKIKLEGATDKDEIKEIKKKIRAAEKNLNTLISQLPQ